MLNLHDIVRPVIGANYPDQELTYYRSLGQTVNNEGVAVSSYAAGVPIMGNFQSEGDAALHYAGLVAEKQHHKKAVCLRIRRSDRKAVGPLQTGREKRRLYQGQTGRLLAGYGRNGRFFRRWLGMLTSAITANAADTKHSRGLEKWDFYQTF